MGMTLRTNREISARTPAQGNRELHRLASIRDDFADVMVLIAPTLLLCSARNTEPDKPRSHLAGTCLSGTSSSSPRAPPIQKLFDDYLPRSSSN